MVFFIHLPKEDDRLQQVIGWYPGHMAKARRLLAEQLKRVDAVIEICDARLPLSSRNPEIDDLTRNKPVLLLLNKADLADQMMTKRWLVYFRQKGLSVMAIEMDKGKAQILKALGRLTSDMFIRAKAHGLVKPARAMILGVPNVGKSTFINLLAGRAAFKVQDRPGITRAPQWIQAAPLLELLDTPGLLWPKLDDPVAARRLAYIAAIRDEVLDVFNLSLQLLEELMLIAPEGVIARYQIKDSNVRGQALMENVCFSRGFLLKGGEADLERGAVCVLDEFRAGLLGRITLEAPDGGALAEG